MDMYPRDPIESLPRSDPAEVAAVLLEPAGKRILDIGCGEGELTRALARAGAEITGVDPHEGRIGRARAKAAEEGVAAAFEIGVGEALAFDAASFDAALLSNSLHHVAEHRMAATIADAARVVRPGGLLYVVEPVPRGPYFNVQCVWNDETSNRARAFEEVAGIESLGFALEKETFFRSSRTFKNAEAYAERSASHHERRRADIVAKSDEIRTAFMENAEAADGTYSLDLIYRVNVFRKSG